MKKKKRKKKKGGSGENVIDDIQGGGAGYENHSMKKIIIILIVLLHLLTLVTAIVGTVVYITNAKLCTKRIENLLRVCQLAGYASRLPAFSIQTLFLDINYKFNYSGINDG